MGNATLTQLSAELQSFLQNPQMVLVTTLDAETGWPTNNLITWVVAMTPDTIRLAADAKGRIVVNLRNDSRVLLTVMTNGACHVIEGKGELVAPELKGPSVKLGCVEIKVQAVRDVTFFGGVITTLPAYETTYDKAVKEKFDNEVFAAMRAV